MNAALRGAHDHCEIVFVRGPRVWRLLVTMGRPPAFFETSLSSFEKRDWKCYLTLLPPREVDALFRVLSSTDFASQEFDWVAAYLAVAPPFMRRAPTLLFGRPPLDNGTYCARAVARALRAVGLCEDLDDFCTSSDVVDAARPFLMRVSRVT